LPHSKQNALLREVINRQNGHILCGGAWLVSVASFSRSFANQSAMEDSVLEVLMFTCRLLCDDAR